MTSRCPLLLLSALLLVTTSARPGLAQTVAPVTVPRFTHPGAGQTFYFVLTDRFANGNPANDTGGYAGGPAEHGYDPTRISHYHGGDFVGLTAKLDYLKNLGVTAVWVTPPFKNKPMQQGTAGYHGYWITDFLAIDPHLGTNEEYRTFVREAHARGMRVFMDIIVNHTADVIGLQGDHSYKSTAAAPYRDAAGQPFDARALAFNGLGNPAAFPALSAATSFPYQPTVPAAETGVKNPAWLNDVTLYHNRGNTTFAGENAVHGDFVGLDDLFTEHPRVVNGFIEIFSHWLEAYGVDGYRIDTARHVNTAFWQAFSPAIRAKAAALGRPDFLQFGEVYNEVEGPSVLSEFSTSTMPIDTTIDFGFFIAARRYVSQAGTAGALADFFARDDYYTDHDSNVHATTTFLGNHDAGRFGYFLQQDNPGASKAQLEALVKFGHGLLYLVRGQPVLYYGDEQGMIGRGGNDMQARESLFPAQAPDFRDATLLGTARTGADEKFDETHPFYLFFKKLAALRANHAALRTGAMLVRPTSDPAVFAFSRVDRTEKVEYFAAFNASRTASVTFTAPTSMRPGAGFAPVFSSDESNTLLSTDAARHVTVTLAPLQFALWKAEAPLHPQYDGTFPPPTIALSNPAPNATLHFSQREADGLLFPSRQEIRAEVTGGDGFAEVTFALRRASRPDQLEWLGTDDAAPYRVFWNPPADLAPGEQLTFVATASDLRGQQVSTEVPGVTVAAPAQPIAFGIPGARGPVLTATSPRRVALNQGAASPTTLFAEATGTAPLAYQWLRDDEEIPGATNATLTVTKAGRYVVLVRNLAGTAISAETVVVPE